MDKAKVVKEAVESVEPVAFVVRTKHTEALVHVRPKVSFYPDETVSGLYDEVALSAAVDAAHEAGKAEATALRDALAAVFEVAAGCDGDEWGVVFSIAHDALASCKGCFPESGTPRPLVPTIAVEMANARATAAEERAGRAEAALRTIRSSGVGVAVDLAVVALGELER